MGVDFNKKPIDPDGSSGTRESWDEVGFTFCDRIP